MSSTAWDVPGTLLGIKIAAAILFAWVIGAGATYYFALALVRGAAPLWRLGLQALALGSCALFVLSRGAPHNNPALFAIYDRYGARGLAISGVLFAAAAVAAGLLAFRFRGNAVVAKWHDAVSNPARRRPQIRLFPALAMLAALEPVARYWDVPGWGDSAFYDRIAQQIALGAMPAGHSYYMPIFQFGTAALYYAFGHFFFVQQLANVALAPLTVIFLSLAAWNIFRDPRAVGFVGLIAATDDVLRHAPYMQQVENWYIPILSFAIFAATKYFRTATLGNLVLLALAAGLVFNIRTQAAFFVGFLMLAPFFMRDVAMGQRLRHFVILGAVFAATLVPWTMRNYVVDGRFWPVGVQGVEHIAYSNDPHTFYGIRRDLAVPEAVQEVGAEQGGEKARLSALERIATAHVFGDPMLLLKAAPWRALAFYGLLPPGIWAKEGPRATDWRHEGPEFLLRVFPILCLIAASAIGLALNPGRATLFLLGAILCNLAIVLFVGFSEPRLSYPVELFHILLAAAAVFALRLEFTIAGGEAGISFRPGRAAAVAAGILGLVAAAHLTLGRGFALREITTKPAAYDKGVAIDAGLPDLAALAPARQPSETDPGTLPLRKGERVRAVVALTNHELPVKYYAFPMPDFPDFAADPATDIYYRTYLLDASGTYDWGDSRQIAVAFAGATFDRPLREEDVVEVQGEVLDIEGRGIIWIHADKVRWLRGWAGPRLWGQTE